MICTVLTANVGLWEYKVKRALDTKNTKVHELETYRKVPKPFFVKKNVIYLEVKSKDLVIEDTDYNILVLYTDKIDLYDYLNRKYTPEITYNSYHALKDDIIGYILEKDIPRKTAELIYKRVGKKMNRLDEAIKNALAGLPIKNYNQISIKELVIKLLMRKVDKSCMKLIASYKYNPKFLIKLIKEEIDKTIDFKIDFNEGKINALNKSKKILQYKKIEKELPRLIYICENVSLNDMLVAQSILAEGKGMITLQELLYKFI